MAETDDGRWLQGVISEVVQDDDKPQSADGSVVDSSEASMPDFVDGSPTASGSPVVRSGFDKKYVVMSDGRALTRPPSKIRRVQRSGSEASSDAEPPPLAARQAEFATHLLPPMLCYLQLILFRNAGTDVRMRTLLQDNLGVVIDHLDEALWSHLQPLLTLLPRLIRLSGSVPSLASVPSLTVLLPDGTYKWSTF